MSSSNFKKCLQHVLQFEGGYVDHPSDPGGATNRGITRKTLARWRGISPWWDLPKSAVRELAENESEAIYKQAYWATSAGRHLPNGIDLAIFDFAVNSGPSRTAKALQKILNVPQDGIIGPMTLTALTRFSRRWGTHIVIKKICDHRRGFLRSLSTFKTFGRGWTKRVNATEQLARQMAKQPQPTTDYTLQPKGNWIMNILSGQKTYIVGILMLLISLVRMAGIELPGFAESAPSQLLLEALAVIFLRKGIKTEIGNA